jgi:hypothetical protein
MATEISQGGLRASLIRIFGGVPAAEAAARAKEAAKQGMQEAFDMTGEDEPVIYTSDGQAIKLGYRQLEQTPRDLSSVSQEKANEASYRLWNTNPLAKALIEIVLDYVLGDGATIQAEDEDVADALRGFWEDPVNDFDGDGAESMVRELALFGEQLFLAFVRDGAEDGFVADGRLRIGPVDPNQIASIITHPLNRRDVLAVRLKSESGGLDDGPIFKVIRAESAGGAEEGVRDLEAYKLLVDVVEGAAKEGHHARITEAARKRRGIDRRLKEGKEWRLEPLRTSKGNQEIIGTGRMVEVDQLVQNAEFDGECFLFQVNKLSTGIRGRSDLLPLIDWLDRYDQLFFDGAEHVQLLNTFLWDLTVEGGSEGSDELEKNLGHQARKVRGAKPNSVYAHNEGVTLEAANPDLKTGDIQTMLRALRVFIAGGLRVPEHWLAEGGFTNRATAREMGEPTHRFLSRRQAFVQRMFMRMCQYQIDVLVALGHLPPEVSQLNEEGESTGEVVPTREAFDIAMPDINISDTRAASQALMNVANAIFRLDVIDMIPARSALELVAAVAELLGVEVDVEAGLEALEGKEKEKDALANLLKGIDPFGTEEEDAASDNGRERSPGRTEPAAEEA